MFPSISQPGRFLPRPPKQSRSRGKLGAKTRSQPDTLQYQGTADVDTWQTLRQVSELHTKHSPGALPEPIAERMQIQVWLDSFHKEKQQYKSVTAYAELFYARVLGATQQLPEPNLLRTATCMMLLDQVSSLFGRYSPLILSLCNQLHAAIFIDNDTDGDISGDAEQYRELTSFEGLLSSKYVRKTYFNAYLDLRQRFKSLESTAAGMVDNMSKQLKVFERAIATWQRAFLNRVFVGWRGYISRQKLLRKKYKDIFANNISRLRMLTAWRNWNVAIEQMKWRNLEQGASAVGTTIENLMSEKKRLQEDLAEERCIVEGRDIKIAALVAENQALRAEKRSATEKYVSAQGVVRRLATLLSDLLSGICSPAYDYRERDRWEAFATNSAEGDGLDFLISWANKMIAENCNEDGKITEFTESIRSGRPYICLLRAMAPAQCSEGWLMRTLGEPNVTKRCTAVISTAEKLGIATTLKSADIVSGAFELNYMFLAQCFRRFADPRGCGKEPRTTCLRDSYVEDTVNLLPPIVIDSEKVSPSDWLDKVHTTFNKMYAWQEKALHVTMKLDDELADSMRRGVARTVTSKKQEAQQALFSDVPLSAFADILSSMRGTGTPKDMHQRVTKMLRTNYDTLRSVFKYYSTQDAVVSEVPDDGLAKTMSFTQFGKMYADCKLGNSFKPNLAVMVSRLESAGLSTALAMPNEHHVPERLGPEAFSLALIHTAASKYNDEELADRIRRLLVECIEPNAKASAAEAFRSEVYSSPVKAVMQAFDDRLSKLYKEHATVKENGELCISLDEWIAFIHSRNLDSSQGPLTLHAASSAFHRVQANADEDSTLTMSYSEFQEALASLAVYRYPCPFEQFSQRLALFFRKDIFHI
ncbi:hypothetical protein DIPPA_70126 [Diplonema papillatum]|nr:hypothetical protein DIPPA_70126 [Diplonema papillatum]